VRILGISVVKNEADIIRPFLEHTTKWADRIYVYDTGSTDNTWEIVQSMANDIIVPWKKDDVDFHNNIRARVFHAFKHEAEPGDWWCYRMDADEFYVDDPQAYLASVPEHYHTVYRKCLNYNVTIEDVEEYDFIGNFSLDRNLIRYFLPDGRIERRFIKHRTALKWDEKKGLGYTGITYPEMILAQHYRWRSPQQIRKRLESKREYLKRKARQKGRHEQIEQIDETHIADQWREHCPHRRDMILDTGPSSWAKVTFDEDHFNRITENWFSYRLKRVLHSLHIVK
jgi:glycosyltransferase involved in cell wall biosynthesis